MKIKVVILEDRCENHNYEKNVFSGPEYQIVEVTDLSDRGKVSSICRDADALLVNLYRVDKNFLDGLEKCRVISRYGIGYDNIDIKAASDKGIKVTNVPGFCNDEVAEHVIALLFSCIRNITVKNQKIRSGSWNIKGAVPIHRISGKKLGIIGYGQTGQALHRKMCCMGLEEIAVYDHHPQKKERIAAANSLNSQKTVFMGFKDLLSNCDFISLNIPLNESTRHIIGKEEFSIMKKTGIIINTSRGGVIDTEAMVYALKNRVIAGAGIDVHEAEPLLPDSELLKLDNIVLTDHAAWHSIESQAELQHKCAAAAEAVLSGRKCDTVVNSISD